MLKMSFFNVLLGLMLLGFSGQVLANCPKLPLPKGAEALNLRTAKIDLCPRLEHVSFEPDVMAPLYNGLWWLKQQPSSKLYSNNETGYLTMLLGGNVATVNRAMKPGLAPLLPGSRSFYVEFTASLSDNDPDHWPAVWLLPVEHNVRQEDAYEGDPPKFERWLEIDVDEGGYANGAMGTALSWSGVWPNYNRIRSTPNLHNAFLDRTKLNRFGAGFDASNKSISFWLNDELQYVARPPSVPDVALKQSFYLIVSAQSRGKNIPYRMSVARVQAFQNDP